MYPSPLYSFLLICLLTISSCRPNSSVDYYSLPAFTENGINVVVEIPAGTNHKIEFNTKTARFENDMEDGKVRVINFLPYPANYGFIPSTLMNKAQGGDGDALDVLLIAESLPTGEVVEARPIAALVLKDQGKLDTKIIALPIDSSLQVMDIRNFEDFMTRYNGAQNIIRDWFVQYKGLGEVEFLAWRNDQYALAEIKRWAKMTEQKQAIKH